MSEFQVGIRLRADGQGAVEQSLGQLQKAILGLGDAQKRFNEFAAVRPAGQQIDESRVRLLEQEAKRLDDVRARYVPLYAEQRNYKAGLDEISNAERRGVLSANEAAVARGRLKTAFAETIRGMSEATIAAKADAEALVNLTRSYQPLSVAMQRLAADEQRLQQLRANGKVDPEQYVAISRAIEEQRKKLQGLNEAQAGTAETGKLAAHQLTNLSAQLQDVVVQLGSGQSAFTVLLQQGPQITSAMGGVSNAFRLVLGAINPVVAAAAIVAGAFALAMARASDLRQEARELDVAIRGAGRSAEISSGQLTTYVRSLERQGVSREDARSLVGGLARTQGLSGGAVGRISGLAADVGAGTGSDAGGAARAIADALTSGYAGIEQLNARLGLFNATQLVTIRQMYETGRASDAANLVLDSLGERFAGLNRDKLSPADEAFRSLRTSWTDFMDAIATSRPVLAAVDLLGVSLRGIASIVNGPSLQRLNPQEREGAALESARDQLTSSQEQLTALRVYRTGLKNNRRPTDQEQTISLPGMGVRYVSPDAEIARLEGVVATLQADVDRLSADPSQLSPDARAAIAARPPGGGTGGGDPRNPRAENATAAARSAADRAARLAATSPSQRALIQADFEASDLILSTNATGADAEAIRAEKRREALSRLKDETDLYTAALARSTAGQLATARAAEAGGAAQMRAEATTQAIEEATSRYGVSVDALTQRLVNQAAAQRAIGGGEIVRQMREQAEAAERMASAEGRGPAAVADQERIERVREMTAQLQAARDATTDPAIRAALDGQITQIGELSQRQARADADRRVARLEREQGQTLAIAEAERLLALETDPERIRQGQIALQVLQAEYAIRQQLAGATEAQIQAELARSRQIVETKAQTAALNGIRDKAKEISKDVADFLVDGFVNASKGGASAFRNMYDGAIAGAKRMAARIAATLLEQQFIMPIVSQVVGGAPGAFGVPGASGASGGAGGAVGQSLISQGVSTAASYLSGGTAAVNAALFGTPAIAAAEGLVVTAGGITGVGMTAGSAATSGLVGAGGTLAGSATLASIALPVAGIAAGLILMSMMNKGRGTPYTQGSIALGENGRLSGYAAGDNEANPAELQSQIDQIVQQLDTITSSRGLKYSRGAPLFGDRTDRTLSQAVDEIASGIRPGETTSRGVRAVLDSGRITGLEQLNELLGRADAFDQLTASLRTTFAVTNQAEEQFKQLSAQLDQAKGFADEFGLSIGDVTTQMAGDFNTQIRRSILSLTNANQLALEDQERTANARIETAKRIGADLVQVEILNGLERKAILDRITDAAAGVTAKPTGPTKEEQIATAKDALVEAYDRERGALEQTRDAFRRLADTLRSTRLGLLIDPNLSPLSPGERVAEARRQFETVAARAQLGDVTAIEQLPDAGRSLLEASKNFYSSSEDYYRDFTRVQQVLESTESVAERQARLADQQLSVMQSQLGQLSLLNTTMTTYASALSTYLGLTGKTVTTPGDGGGVNDNRPLGPFGVPQSGEYLFGGAVTAGESLNKLNVNALYQQFFGRDAEAGVAEQWMAYGGRGFDLASTLERTPEFQARLKAVQGLRTGGWVGNGVWNRDSVLAAYAGGGQIALAGGEYVVNAPMAARYGDQLEAMNSGRSVRVFADEGAYSGGPVVTAIERLNDQVARVARNIAAVGAATIEVMERVAENTGSPGRARRVA